MMIRDSRTDDINAIMKLWLDTNLEVHDYVPKEYFTDHYDSVKAAISKGVTVYEDDGEILGFIGLINSYIAGLFVNKDRRSEGIGSRLVEYVKKNHETLSLDVFLNNGQAIKFYLKEGFHVVHRQQSDETGFEEYHMEWRKD